MSVKQYGSYNVRPVAVGMLPRGHQWTVKDLGDTMAGYADIIGRELGVSRNAGNPWTRFVQLHEQAHVTWSKYHLKGIAKAAGLDMTDPRSESYVQAAEDARVNTRLRRAVPDSGEGFVLDDNAPLRYDLQGYMAAYNTSDQVRQMIRSRLELEGKGKQCDLIDKECDRIAKGKLTASSMTVPLTKLMRTLVEGHAEQEKDDGDGDGDGEGQGEQDDDSPKTSGAEKGDTDTDLDDDGEKGKKKKATDDDDDDESNDDEQKDETPPQIDEAGASEAEKDEDAADLERFGESKRGWNDKPILEMPEGTETAWTIPEIATPPLRITVQRPGTHNSIASDSGVILRDVTRIATDGQVFSRSRQRPGTIRRGTFLLDASGSMALSVKDVEEIINAVPSATVALYSGARRRAFITIVAKDGKRCDLRQVEFLGGNTCDGPGLLWLSRQYGPRFWYCDGLVTNRSEQVNQTIVDECEALKVAGRIIHINPEHNAGLRCAGIAKRNGAGTRRTSIKPEGHGAYIVRVMRELHLVR